jgi:nucleoside-diphosphate-sugar epimerase
LKKILNNTDIRKKIICFTGATGFVGSKLLYKLIEIGCNVKVLTRNKNTTLSKNVRTYVGDLTDQNSNLSAFIKDCDIFFNCAGEKNNHTKMRSLHVNGTQNLLDKLRHEAAISNKKIHWIQLSSCGAYGSLPKENLEVKRIVTESSKTKPTNEYERTKTESDELVIKASTDQLILYTILRPSNIIDNIAKDTSINKLIKLLNLGFFFLLEKKML